MLPAERRRLLRRGLLVLAALAVFAAFVVVVAYLQRPPMPAHAIVTGAVPEGGER